MSIIAKKLLKKIIPIIIAVIIFYVIDVTDLPQSQKIVDISSDVHHVTHIVDGDTFDIETGERVRMIGMDTPERGKVYYAEATAQLKSLIDDKDVTLQKDVSEKDRYGRLLRHVYIGDLWINKQMVIDGYARFVTFPPDVMHVESFKQAEQEARNNKRGLWSQ